VTISWNAFGASLEGLIREQPAALCEASPVSPLAAPESRRAAFRLQFCNGVTLKGRCLETAQQAETVWRLWQLHLRSAPVAQIVARRSEALLEEWLPGYSIAGGSEYAQILGAAGTLLGRFHRMGTSASIARRAVTARWIDDSLEIEPLVRARLLEDKAAQEAMALARTSAPASAEWGLCHGDFCAENLLIVPERGLHVVDNETICELWYDCDLARTWYRWPMDAAEFEMFLDGYRTHRKPNEFLAHFRFWTICVLLRSAMYRRRNGISTEAPLTRLQSLLRNPSRSRVTP
jgi:hypothetical protein